MLDCLPKYVRKLSLMRFPALLADSMIRHHLCYTTTKNIWVTSVFQTVSDICLEQTQNDGSSSRFTLPNFLMSTHHCSKRTVSSLRETSHSWCEGCKWYFCQLRKVPWGHKHANLSHFPLKHKEMTRWVISPTSSPTPLSFILGKHRDS